MTTERQAAANRRNAARSTGPRSGTGKAVVARNAVKHGVFATLPVIPGVERHEDWEAHRAGILNSLAPVGLLETRLAERAAGLLWRLDRVARYETVAIAVGMEEAADDPQRNPFDELLDRESDAARLKKATAEHEKKRRFLADTEVGLAAFARLPGLADDEPVSSVIAYVILEGARDAAPGEDDYPWIEDEEFLTGLGVPEGVNFDQADWTAGLVRRGVAVIARAARTDAETLTTRALRGVKEHRDDLAGQVRDLTATVKALRRKRQVQVERQQARLILPEVNAEGRVIRYENHLSRQLFQTLHELERIQASRAGRPVPAPLAVEVGVNVAGPEADEVAG